MQKFLRAGLAGLTLAFLLALAAAAPIHPGSAHSSSALSHHAPAQALGQQAPFGIVHSDVHSHTPGIISTNEGGVAARELAALHRRSIFTKIKHAFQKVGHAIKHVAQKIGSGIKHVAQKVGAGIKKAAVKVGQGIKTAAKKVGHFVKTTGAKIAKVGLKIWSTATKIASKVVGFIPVIGKPLSRVMSAEASVANTVSDKIHAHIGGKLGTAMNRMSKAQKIVGYIPRGLADDEYQALSERELYDVNVLLEARAMDQDWLEARGSLWDDWD